MIAVRAFATPSSVTDTVAPEELGLDHALDGVNLRQGEQLVPEFVAGDTFTIADTAPSGWLRRRAIARLETLVPAA